MEPHVFCGSIPHIRGRTVLKYIAKRLLILIPVLLGVSFLVFGILALMPSEVAAVQLGVPPPGGDCANGIWIMG